ncbi:protein of unknown function [Methylocaldum szegediense]|uniref:Uncharacterized protein n=1 Tax=Methylocaldum szegediense TaxID=73780 RepID=A0ABM9HYZ6_9GAMM|nr:protein of unknown function [Methylocaldum szegediense]
MVPSFGLKRDLIKKGLRPLPDVLSSDEGFGLKRDLIKKGLRRVVPAAALVFRQFETRPD